MTSSAYTPTSSSREEDAVYSSTPGYGAKTTSLAYTTTPSCEEVGEMDTSRLDYRVLFEKERQEKEVGKKLLENNMFYEQSFFFLN